MKRSLAILLALCTMAASFALAADDEISFKKRGDEEKRFAAKVSDAVIKAAHSSAKKIEMLSHEYKQPKPNRTEMVLKIEYHGALTDKRYVADVVIKIDSTDKNAWEVLNIDYADTNAAVKHNEKKIQELIKQFNK